MKNQALTDITRGLQHAAQTTVSLLAEQHIRLLHQFFNWEENGTLRAKTVRLEVTDDNYVHVPLISLVGPKGLALEKMRVNMSVRLEEAKTKPATGSFDNSEVTRTAFEVSMAPRGMVGERRKTEVMDIELEFKAGDPPEAFMRVMDVYTNTINPVGPPQEVTSPKDDTSDTPGVLSAQPDEQTKKEQDQKRKKEQAKDKWKTDYAKMPWFKKHLEKNKEREDKKKNLWDKGDLDTD